SHFQARRQSPLSSSSDRRAICRWPVFESPFCAGSMLMDPDVRRIDEDIFEIGIIRQTLENSLPSTLLCPPPEPGVDGEPVAELRRQITPGCTSSCNP